MNTLDLEQGLSGTMRHAREAPFDEPGNLVCKKNRSTFEARQIDGGDVRPPYLLRLSLFMMHHRVEATQWV